MADFERGRAHLVSVVTLKLSHWSQVPYGLFGVAHPIPEKALKCYQKAIGSEDRHRLTRSCFRRSSPATCKSSFRMVAKLMTRVSSYVSCRVSSAQHHVLSDQWNPCIEVCTKQSSDVVITPIRSSVW